MKQKDEGVIQKLLAMIMLLWAVICWGILLSVMKAGYTSRFLEDCLTQANLAALVVDPYHYGSTGELVFEDVHEIKQIFKETLEAGLGDNTNRQRLGLEEVTIIDFRLYEVTEGGVSEMILDRIGNSSTIWYNSESVVMAPDGTHIQNSAIYARIAVPVEFLFGVKVIAIKEHCADIVSEVET